MAYEIEIKAHVNESEIDKIRKSLLENCNAEFLGKIDKEDIYWHREEENFPVLRTRLEEDNGTKRILLTAKPKKEKSTSGTEKNQEFEFSVSPDQWNDCLEFCKATGLEVFRRKWKSGWHYNVNSNGFFVHSELLNVRYLGWFLELEICPDTLDNVDIEKADSALRCILAKCNIDESDIEKKGYNSMLIAVSHEKG